jgi:hypothetical protein
MGIVLLDAQLQRQLGVDRLNQLPHGAMPMFGLLRDLYLLIGPLDGAEADAVLTPQFGRYVILI